MNVCPFVSAQRHFSTTSRKTNLRLFLDFMELYSNKYSLLFFISVLKIKGELGIESRSSPNGQQQWRNHANNMARAGKHSCSL